MNTLASEIQAAIIQQGYTSKEVAQAIQITPQYLTDITKNRRTPSDEVLDKLIRHLNLNRNYAYYLVNRYPPEIRGKDITLPILDRALDWLLHPHKYTLKTTKAARETIESIPAIDDPVITEALKDIE